MDPITHTLTGAAIGQAGLKRMTALAWPALLIGANLPDVDILSYFRGDMQALAFRRGVTHGLVAMLVLPVLLTGFLYAWDRALRRPWHRWRRARGRVERPLEPIQPSGLLLVSAAAVWSHPILDWLNIYGIRLLAPFSDRWFYGDALFIVDLWVWLALGSGVWLSRLRGAFPSRVALTAVAVYAVAMWTGSALARADTASRLQDDPLSVLAAPVPLDPTVRMLIVETETRYLRGRVDGRGDFSLEASEKGILKRWDLAARAFRHPDARAFLYWSRYPYFEPVEGGIRVRDARYDWAATVIDSD